LYFDVKKIRHPIWFVLVVLRLVHSFMISELVSQVGTYTAKVY